jgi:hypothetical protein
MRKRFDAATVIAHVRTLASVTTLVGMQSVLPLGGVVATLKRANKRLVIHVNGCDMHVNHIFVLGFKLATLHGTLDKSEPVMLFGNVVV